MKKRFPYYPRGVFIKGTAQYDYFWMLDPTAGFENVNNFDFQELTDEDLRDEKTDLSHGDCYCDSIASEFGWRHIRFWKRIVGKLRSQAMTAHASPLVRTVWT